MYVKLSIFFSLNNYLILFPFNINYIFHKLAAFFMNGLKYIFIAWGFIFIIFQVNSLQSRSLREVKKITHQEYRLSSGQNYTIFTELQDIIADDDDENDIQCLFFIGFSFIVFKSIKDFFTNKISNLFFSLVYSDRLSFFSVRRI